MQIAFGLAQLHDDEAGDSDTPSLSSEGASPSRSNRGAAEAPDSGQKHQAHHDAPNSSQGRGHPLQHHLRSHGHRHAPSVGSSHAPSAPPSGASAFDSEPLPGSAAQGPASFSTANDDFKDAYAFAE